MSLCRLPSWQARFSLALFVVYLFLLFYRKRRSEGAGAGGILEERQTRRRKHGKTVQQATATGRRHPMLRRGADQFGKEPVCDDQAGFLAEQVGGEIRVNGEIQRIAEVAIFRPFAVGKKVARAGFHFDASKTPVRPQREEVGAAAVR